MMLSKSTQFEVYEYIIRQENLCNRYLLISYFDECFEQSILNLEGKTNLKLIRERGEIFLDQFNLFNFDSEIKPSRDLKVFVNSSFGKSVSLSSLITETL